ncbi:AGAP001244-PA-like protein [Anopheles sinensis]|uniref:AGAP001244-PA-like protein n=1 Tax=Anopheles sinensis TaxID=74873 RepID=A0A084W058_ANOSI|nr:AGAP001244-PA-like protein [Anopheles sinensis]
MKVLVVVCVVAFAVASATEENAIKSRMQPDAARLIDERQEKSTLSSLKKIVGGVSVSIEQYPYQLSLRNYDYHICGASIISNVWALTAAHCLYPDPDPKTISLRAGTSNQSRGGRIYNASRIIIHPMYNPSWMDNDVAVIRVSTPFSGPNTEQIRLVPQGFEPITGIRAIVTGWGRQSEDSTQVMTLAGVEIPIVDKEDCSSQWNGVEVTPQ